MNRILAILGGIGFGAFLMYLFDPQGGNRRRALIRDKAVGLSNQAQKTVSGKAEDLSNRAKGLLHETKSIFTGENQVSDENQNAKGQTA
ncbi:MAG: hypothetical protein M3Q78_11210 [Acidobacteriota bacterium]|nr:hypothetical protein [Acidobacteriota bacterium]